MTTGRRKGMWASAGGATDSQAENYLPLFCLPMDSETKGRKKGKEGEKIHSCHRISNVAILKMKEVEE